MSKPLPSRILGIDYGMARSGLALSDERKIIAFPWMVFPMEKKVEQNVVKLIQAIEKHTKEHHYFLEAIVVGLPFMMNGKVGLIADEVKTFIAELQKFISIPIVKWDERLSSVQAERSLRESSLSRKRRSKIVDAVSAVIILQSYLDHK
ncbi:MAG TPA: Holliday junction resolvase RuvX, partial [Waddliaceae bacterium]